MSLKREWLPSGRTILYFQSFRRQQRTSGHKPQGSTKQASVSNFLGEVMCSLGSRRMSARGRNSQRVPFGVHEIPQRINMFTLTIPPHNLSGRFKFKDELACGSHRDAPKYRHRENCQLRFLCWWFPFSLANKSSVFEINRTVPDNVSYVVLSNARNDRNHSISTRVSAQVCSIEHL